MSDEDASRDAKASAEDHSSAIDGESGDKKDLPVELQPKTVEINGVKVTQYGTVRVAETPSMLGPKSEANSEIKTDAEGGDAKEGPKPGEEGYLSDDEKDEELPPALRFIKPGDVVDVSDTSMERLEWIGTSGQKVTVVTGVEHLTNLESFCLRSNFVREVSALATLTNLVSLELYENRLNTLEGVQHLVNLTNLDISYNRLRELDPAILAPLTKLERLYVAENKLSKIQGLETLTQLRVLDLGMNRIRKMEGLNQLVNLEELWLGRNKIERVEGIDELKKLVRISVQSNRMRHIGDGFAGLESLEELYLSHQGIEEFSGLETLTKLDTIDVSNNRIKSMDGLPVDKLPNLKELWMSYNGISTFEEIEKLKPLSEQLSTIYLDHNPIARDYEYRKRLAATLPSLEQIDAVRFR